ncbi:hypothetical protein [Myxococcus xanthus]|nr:hypothetical protein [Myxococcus xanthus]
MGTELLDAGTEGVELDGEPGGPGAQLGSALRRGGRIQRAFAQLL